MEWLAWVIALSAALVLLDRLALAAERRGWIYWRRRSARGGSLGAAMLSVQSVFEPDKQHVVDEAQRLEADIDRAGNQEPLEPRSG